MINVSSYNKSKEMEPATFSLLIDVKIIYFKIYSKVLPYLSSSLLEYFQKNLTGNSKFAPL